jgi:hypothetical protein
MARRRHSWVRKVAETSDAMDLPRDIFKRSPPGIARGLKESVLRSRRTRGTKFQSAMSMLNLYINRAGRQLSGADRRRLEAAKPELRRAFGRSPEPRTTGADRAGSARAAPSRSRPTRARAGRAGARASRAPAGRSRAPTSRAQSRSRRSRGQPGRRSAAV